MSVHPVSGPGCSPSERPGRGSDDPYWLRPTDPGLQHRTITRVRTRTTNKTQIGIRTTTRTRINQRHFTYSLGLNKTRLITQFICTNINKLKVKHESLLLNECMLYRCVSVVLMCAFTTLYILVVAASTEWTHKPEFTGFTVVCVCVCLCDLLLLSLGVNPSFVLCGFCRHLGLVHSALPC